MKLKEIDVLNEVNWKLDVKINFQIQYKKWFSVNVNSFVNKIKLESDKLTIYWLIPNKDSDKIYSFIISDEINHFFLTSFDDNDKPKIFFDIHTKSSPQTTTMFGTISNPLTIVSEYEIDKLKIGGNDE